MGTRLALRFAAAALGSSLVMASPALAQVVIDGKDLGIEPQAEVEYGTVPTEGAQTESAPKKAPPPPTSGCPYRNQKLDLIV